MAHIAGVSVAPASHATVVTDRQGAHCQCLLPCCGSAHELFDPRRGSGARTKQPPVSAGAVGRGWRRRCRGRTARCCAAGRFGPLQRRTGAAEPAMAHTSGTGSSTACPQGVWPSMMQVPTHLLSRSGRLVSGRVAHRLCDLDRRGICRRTRCCSCCGGGPATCCGSTWSTWWRTAAAGTRLCTRSLQPRWLRPPRSCCRRRRRTPAQQSAARSQTQVHQETLNCILV
jgi:hypothetical protein